MQLNAQQTATICAALRHWNHAVDLHGVNALGGSEFFQHTPPLGPCEVVELLLSIKNDKGHEVLLVDQASIPAALGAISLFVDGRHILDVDESRHYPAINDMADSLASALNTTVQRVELTETRLALYLAECNGTRDELDKAIAGGETDLDDWVQGYNNEDVIGAVNANLP